MKERKVLKTALLYGEGSHEYTFFNFLLKTEKFAFLESNWYIDTDHASGCSCKDIIDSCIKAISGNKPDVVLCFIDTDDLKHDFPKTHKLKKN